MLHSGEPRPDLCCSAPHPRETPPPQQLLASSSHSSPVPCAFVVQFSSVTQTWLTLCNPMDHSTPGGSCPSPSLTPRVYPNSCPLSRWCHPTISPSVGPFFFPQSFLASGSFQKSQLFASGAQIIGASASTPVLPVNIQDWFPLGWTGWISLQSKGLSRVFSNTIVQKHQFFSAQLSL